MTSPCSKSLILLLYHKYITYVNLCVLTRSLWSGSAPFVADLFAGNHSQYTPDTQTGVFGLVFFVFFAGFGLVERDAKTKLRAVVEHALELNLSAEVLG
jgi:hypothetical protein